VTCQGENSNFFNSLASIYGHLCAIDNVPYDFEQKEITLLENMANFLAYVVELEKTKDEIENQYKKIINQNNSILQVVGEGIFGLDTDGNTLFINQTAIKMSGYQESEILGKSLHSMIHHTKNNGQHYPPEECPIFNTIESGSTHQINDEVFWRKDGTCFPVEYISVPMYEQGNIVGTVVSFRDITEKKQAQEALLSSEKLSVAGQLAAGIAHEVRNPLTAIKGFLQLIRDDVKEHQSYFEIIDSEMDRIEIILSELLVLAKPQESKFEQRNIGVILQHVVTLINTQAILNNIQIKTSIVEGLPMIDCDENQIKQVFINFLKNSIEAMSNGGNIDINVEKYKQKIIITIIDEGCGIPEDILKKLGQPFISTKEEGTGLGLMICQRIIENHKGKFQVSSNANGTKVNVELPISNI